MNNSVWDISSLTQLNWVYLGVLAVLIMVLGACGSPEPAQTAISVTPVPDSTPVPIATTVPTVTPVPIATTVPTVTPVPIATTVLTVTPVPIATTVPTVTPVPIATTVSTVTPVPIATTVPTSNPALSIMPNINIFDAITQESISDVKQHISAKTNLNDSFIPIGLPWAGAAALHLATVIGNEEIVQLLLENGANIEIRAKDQPGGTPLQWAAFWAKGRLVELLVNAGADIDAEDNNGCTPLCAATIQNPYAEEDENFVNNRTSIRAFLVSRGGKAEDVPGGDMQGPQGTQTSGGSGAAFIEEVPKLQNLLIKNLGPYDSVSATFGDIRYKADFDKLVLDVFGYIHNKGQPNQYDNPTFEFKTPADTVVIVPVSGKIFNITWQATESYLQDDWEILIRSSQHSEWAINVDHIISIDCDRSGKAPVTCNKPLRIGGQVVTEGMSVEAGQVLGYVGNWSDYNNVGINGRVELTIMKYLFKEGSTPGPDTFIGAMNYCPTMYLAKEVESDMKATLTELMQSYENWAGDASIYEQEKMVAPGCLYKAIKEFKGVTEPITK